MKELVTRLLVGPDTLPSVRVADTNRLLHHCFMCQLLHHCMCKRQPPIIALRIMDMITVIKMFDCDVTEQFAAHIYIRSNFSYEWRLHASRLTQHIL
jgi:hypothetical protein